MSFNWDQYNPIAIPKNSSADKKDVVPVEDDIWDQFDPIRREDSPAERESNLKYAIRTALQAPLGFAKSITWPMDIVKLIGTTESQQELEDWETNLDTLKKTFPQMKFPEKIDREKFIQAIQSASEMVPTQENVERVIEEKTGIPLQPKTGLQKDIRLGGEAAGFKPGGIAQKAIAAPVAASTSFGLKQIGIPEEYSEGIGILLSQVPYGGIGVVDEATQQIVNRAKNIGLTEREIVPLIQSKTKMKILGGIGKKGAKTEQLVRDIHEMLGNGFTELRSREISSIPLSEESRKAFIGSSQRIMSDLPAGMRDTIVRDYEDTISKPITADSLINFWQDLNYYIDRGERRLGLLKQPIQDSLETLSPELAQDFKLTNDLYSRYARVRKNLTPGLSDQLIKASKVIGIGGSLVKNIVTGNLPALTYEVGAIVGVEAGRSLAMEMLTNPNLYNLSMKLTTASPRSIPHILNKMQESIEKIDKRVSKELSMDELSAYLQK